MTWDRKAAYRLTDVQDHQGHSRVESRKLYRDRVGCLATDLHWDGPTLRMTFVRDGAGNYIKRHLHTSTVLGVEERDGLLAVKTENSVYLLEPAGEAVPPEPPLCFPADALGEGYKGELIELYLMEENDHFAKGTYWDARGTAHPLGVSRHLGTVVDSCLLYREDGEPGQYYGRYYLESPGEVEFYDTLYGQQDYSVPILIHNCGTIPLTISLEGYGQAGTVDPGKAALFRLDRSGAGQNPDAAL